MRGKAAAYLTKHIAQRITPAYAGKSQPYIYKLNHYKDHPRLCGEKASPRCRFLFFVGSPPPMRGKEILRQFGVPLCRITPAYAGKSAPLARNHFTGEDHPRLCGEKFRLSSL